MDKENKATEGRYRLLALVEGRAASRGEHSDDSRFVWPDLVFKEFLVAIAVVVLLVVWSLLVNAPLGPEADPSWTENPAKAPWYFLGLQELLVYFDPWLAGVVIPGLIVVGLIAIPYVDINNPVSGEYRLAERKKGNVIFLFGFIFWFVLIVIGTFLRGPSWNFYWPWESWEIIKHADDASWSFHWLAGAFFLGAFYIGGAFLPIVMCRGLLQRLGTIRYLIIAFLALSMFFIPVKIALRLLFNVKYVLITPFFNI
jgi:hypothetical protein